MQMSLDKLASIFHAAGEELADIRNWLEYPQDQLMARPSFMLLLENVPGLEAGFLGMKKLHY